MRLLENIDAGARWHRGGDGHDLVVRVGKLGQRFPEYLGVRGRVGPLCWAPVMTSNLATP